MENWGFSRSTLILALLVAPAAAHAANTPGTNGTSTPGNDDTKIIKISEDCRASATKCLPHFEVRDESKKEHSSQGGFTLFIKGSGLSFWGVKQDLYYTEVPYPLHGTVHLKRGPVDYDKVEFQIGFGYMLYAKQRDANISCDAAVCLVAAGVEAGNTQFSASIIGLAPAEKLDCGDKDDQNPSHQLLCSLDMQPVVTESYFEAAVKKLATAYDNWARHALVPATAGAADVHGSGAATAAAPTIKFSVCPQVINFRGRDSQDNIVPIAADDTTPTIISKIAHINAILARGCAGNRRPNAHVRYQSGKPERVPLEQISVAENQATQTSVTQGYYRNEVFLADTGKRSCARCAGTAPASPQFPYAHYPFYAVDDQFAEITMVGLTDSAALPSVLASIVTYTRSDLTRSLHVATQCSGGAVKDSVPDDATDPVAFTTLVAHARTDVDEPHDGQCPTGTSDLNPTSSGGLS